MRSCGIFGSDKVSPLLGKLGMTEDMPIEHPFISKAIENAQTRVEGHNFEIRKYLLEYDNVMNKQRETVYGMRKEMMSNTDIRERVYEMVEDICEGFVDEFAPEKVYPEEWDLASLKNRIYETFFFHIDFGRARPQEHHQGRLPRHGNGKSSGRLREEGEGIWGTGNQGAGTFHCLAFS